MIETATHANDARRQVRSIRSTARRASRRRRCWRARRAGDRSAGRGHAHLHLHLHDGELPARGAPPRRAGGRLRPPESDRRRRRRRPDARRTASSRSSASIPIPMRHGMTIGELARLFNEHFGIGADLEVVTMQGWRASSISTTTGLPWVLPSPNIPTLDTRDRLSGHGAVRRHERVRRARHDAGRSSWSARRGSTPSDSPTHERGWGCRACTSVRRCSSRRSTSTRRLSCGGCQIHVIDRADVPRRCETGVGAASRRSARPAPGGFAWRAAALRVRTRRSCRSTSSTAPRRCATDSARGDSAAALAAELAGGRGAVPRAARTVSALLATRGHRRRRPPRTF